MADSLPPYFTDKSTYKLVSTRDPTLSYLAMQAKESRRAAVFAPGKTTHNLKFRLHNQHGAGKLDNVILRIADGRVLQGWPAIVDYYLRCRFGTDRLEDFAAAYPPLRGKFDVNSDSVEVRVIPDTDEREHMRGLKTVVARRRIVRGEVLMEYSGYCAFEFEHIRTSLPWHRFEKENRLFECTSAAAYDVTVPVDVAERFFVKPGKHRNAPIVIDGFDGGTWPTEILDRRYRPFMHGYEEGHLGAQSNCEFVELEVLGWPLLVCVAICDIEAGDELLIDYGNEYWARTTRNLRDKKMYNMNVNDHLAITEKHKTAANEVSAGCDLLRRESKVVASARGLNITASNGILSILGALDKQSLPAESKEMISGVCELLKAVIGSLEADEKTYQLHIDEIDTRVNSAISDLSNISRALRDVHKDNVVALCRPCDNSDNAWTPFSEDLVQKPPAERQSCHQGPASENPLAFLESLTESYRNNSQQTHDDPLCALKRVLAKLGVSTSVQHQNAEPQTSDNHAGSPSATSLTEEGEGSMMDENEDGWASTNQNQSAGTPPAAAQMKRKANQPNVDQRRPKQPAKMGRVRNEPIPIDSDSDDDDEGSLERLSFSYSQDEQSPRATDDNDAKTETSSKPRIVIWGIKWRTTFFDAVKTSTEKQLKEFMSEIHHSRRIPAIRAFIIFICNTPTGKSDNERLESLSTALDSIRDLPEKTPVREALNSAIWASLADLLAQIAESQGKEFAAETRRSLHKKVPWVSAMQFGFQLINGDLVLEMSKISGRGVLAFPAISVKLRAMRVQTLEWRANFMKDLKNATDCDWEKFSPRTMRRLVAEEFP